MKQTQRILIALMMMKALLLTAATTWYGPHLTGISPWVNRIVIFNTGNQDADATLTIRNQNGTVVHDIDLTIPALDQKTVVLTRYGEYETEPDEIRLDAVEGTFQIETTSMSIVPLVSFQYGDSASISQFFLSSETDTGWLLPNMHAAHFTWTGAAVSNPGDSPLTITLSAVQDGLVVDRTEKTVVAESKFVGLTDDIWPGISLMDVDQILIRADTPVPAPILITGNDEQDRHVFFSGVPVPISASSSALSYPIVDTGQTTCYDNTSVITAPSKGHAFYGQDAQYDGHAPGYTDNGDGTVTDNVTGLMWQQDPGEKMTLDEAMAKAETFNLAGYTDWRLPTIKELYSLILFSGKDPSGVTGTDTSGLTPFIDDVFDFEYGDPSSGERIIDAQFASSSIYTSTTMDGNDTMFGVNFADGRIKGYPCSAMPGGRTKTFFVLYVRGNTGYGTNQFVDNGDGTITDTATGLMWMQEDSGHLGAGSSMDGALNWEQALNFAENLTYAGYDDWRVPDTKELESIVDYTRSPDATGSAAIDPVFQCSAITNEAGQVDYPYYWSSTTHANDSVVPGGYGAYVAFGRALGYWNGRWQDVHGAGAQRSDPKSGDPGDYPYGHGPQGDAIRIYNYVRCVRTAN